MVSWDHTLYGLIRCMYVLVSIEILLSCQDPKNRFGGYHSICVPLTNIDTLNNSPFSVFTI